MDYSVFGRTVKSVVKTVVYSIFPRLKDAREKKAVNAYYQNIAADLERDAVPLMNWGYAHLNGEQDHLHLEQQDEPNRLSLQLYHHVASQVDLTGLEVLDVGCGRGGGADFVMRYLKPQKVVGVDYLKSHIDLCEKTYSVDGLSFRHGDAEKLPFEDASFDAIVNIESSHCYPNLDRFYREVLRVLRRGGYFLYADFGSEWEMLLRKHTLNKYWQLCLIRAQDITENIVRGQEVFKSRRNAMLRTYFPEEKKYHLYRELWRLEGTAGFNRFRDRMEVYASFLYQKHPDS